jgi:hypothetical protein
MAERIYKSFKEFYPYYLKEHSDKTNRTLHFIGTGLVIATLIIALFLKKFNLLFFIPILGYGFAWFGHFKFEKNKPATFTYPLWSLASDFLMFYHILTGQIDKKMKDY